MIIFRNLVVKEMLEIIKTGVFDSSVVFKNMEKTPERITESFEIELYVSGKGQSVIDGKEYTHEKGNLLFIHPGQKRYSKLSFVCYHVHLNMDSETAALLAQVPLIFNVLNYSEYTNIFEEIIKLYGTRSELAQLMLQSKLYQLLHMICSDSRLDSVATPKPIKAALAFMEDNFQKHILLQDIANHVNLSPTYFHKLFKSAARMTPQKYLSELRLNHAKMLLLTTDYSVEEISEKCGFTSISYFDSHFKKNYGITPVGFRKQKYTL